MIERPMLFNADMVRAILSDRKTQTRRAIKPQPLGNGPYKYHSTWGDFREIPQYKGLKCPYGISGDRLWVRESWSTPKCLDGKKPSELVNINSLHYWADEEKQAGRKRPSIHMPRWASRIDLEITHVRAERLQEINEDDALAEGVDGEKEAAERGSTWYDKPRRAYRFLWESINGQGSWDANPWVWVIEFKRINHGS